MRTTVTIETGQGGKLVVELGPYGKVLVLTTHGLSVQAAADLMKRTGLKLYHMSMHERPVHVP